MIDITIDFESYYDAQVGFAKLSTPEYVGHPEFKVHMMGIKIADEEIAIIDEPNIPAVLDHLDSLGDINLICQNVLFDGYVLHHIYNWHPAFYSDTAAMSRGLAPNSSARLKDFVQRIFPKRLDLRKGSELAHSKGVRDLHQAGLFNTIGNYCIQDVLLTHLSYRKMLKEFPTNELLMINMLAEMFCKPVIKLDKPLLENHLLTILKEKQKLIDASGTTKEVLASNPQYANLIEAHGVKCPMKVSPATGKPTYAFAKGDLPYQKFQKDNPQLAHLFRARQAVKSTIEETRCERFINIANVANNKMPAALKYSAAHTHRLGGSDKTNLQNLPRGGVLRLALRAPKKQVILVRDLSNIEARILAVIADQHDLIEIFRQNGDPYSVMAEKIYGHPINKHQYPTERGVGKMAVLGLGYGMSGAKFKDTLNAGPLGMPPIHLSDDTMYDHIVYNVYRKTNTGITNFWKTCDRFIYWMATASDTYDPLMPDEHVLEYKCLKIYKGRIELPNGLYLHYPNLRAWQGGWGYDTKSGTTTLYGGKLTENIVQALAQIVIKSVMLETTRQLPEWRVALQVHDEILAIGLKKDVKKANKVIEKIMGKAPSWMPNLPLNSEGGWAKNYSK